MNEYIRGCVRRCRHGRSLQRVVVDLERQAVGEETGTVLDSEVQVRRGGVATVSEQADLLPGPDALAAPDADRTGLQVRVGRVPMRADLHDHVVTPVVLG